MSVRAETDDRARTRREVVSFVRRSARLTTHQRLAWDRYASRWVIDVPHADTETSIAPGFSLDLAAEFGRTAPLIVEIGSGMGGSLVGLATARPEANLLAFEVYQPAVAATLVTLARAGADNVRLVQANAVDGLTTVLPECSIDELWLFFPDPWPKARHHKRRLVRPTFVDLAASRLRPGALWRLATDAEHYARQMRRHLDASTDLVNVHPVDETLPGEEHHGWAPRWAERPVSSFEERAQQAGRRVYELTFQRR